MMVRIGLSIGLAFFIFLEAAHAEESVADQTSRGDHYGALKQVFEADENLKLTDLISAAKSAWALGLSDVSRDYWRRSLAHHELTGTERYRALLAQAILEFQESRYDAARKIAEKAAGELESSDIRSQFWLVIADSLKEQDAFSLAQQYYRRAVSEATGTRKTEARFLLAECQHHLGLFTAARKNFVLTETGTPYTEKSLRYLIEIDLSQQNYDGIVTWVNAGREQVPESFNDQWVSYAYIVALINLNKSELAKKELAGFKIRHSADSSWYALAEAAVESELVQQLYPRARLRPPAE